MSQVTAVLVSEILISGSMWTTPSSTLARPRTLETTVSEALSRVQFAPAARSRSRGGSGFWGSSTRPSTVWPLSAWRAGIFLITASPGKTGKARSPISSSLASEASRGGCPWTRTMFDGSPPLAKRSRARLAASGSGSRTAPAWRSRRHRPSRSGVSRGSKSFDRSAIHRCKPSALMAKRRPAAGACWSRSWGPGAFPEGASWSFMFGQGPAFPCARFWGQSPQPARRACGECSLFITSRPARQALSFSAAPWPGP